MGMSKYYKFGVVKFKISKAMIKNLLLLLLLLGLQVLNAQSLNRANVEAYVKSQYGQSWKDIALYFADKDVLDKDNALNFEKTFSV